MDTTVDNTVDSGHWVHWFHWRLFIGGICYRGHWLQRSLVTGDTGYKGHWFLRTVTYLCTFTSISGQSVVTWYSRPLEIEIMTEPLSPVNSRTITSRDSVIKVLSLFDIPLVTIPPHSIGRRRTTRDANTAGYVCEPVSCCWPPYPPRLRLSVSLSSHIDLRTWHVSVAVSCRQRRRHQWLTHPPVTGDSDGRLCLRHIG